jgi:hypothetical protein
MNTILFLVKTVELSKFKIAIYSTNQNLNLDDEIATLFSKLETYNYPKDIISELLVLYGVNLVEVFDLNEQLILASSNILPDDIIYE